MSANGSTFRWEGLKKLVTTYELTHLIVGELEYYINGDYIDMLSSEMDVIVLAGNDVNLGAGSGAVIMKKPFYGFPLIELLNEGRKGPAHEGSQKAGLDLRGYNALVVDDEPMNLIVAKGIFSGYGMEITTAGSGQEAIDLCLKDYFDLVFMDHMMPGMDGVEAVGKIREFDKELPVYALTANSTAGEEYYKKKGFNGYLSKPIDSETLERTLMQHIPDEMMEKPAEDDIQEEITEIPEDMKWIYETEGISVEEGLKNSGGVSSYIFSLNLFLDTIDGNAQVIRDAYDSGNIRLYTIKVHALKSSARIIGAMELSGLAESLENAGNKQDTDFIKDNTGKLMSEYEAYKEKLSRLKQQDAGEDRQPIAEEELQDAYDALADSIAQMDYDAAEMVLDQCAEYRLPDEDAKRMDELRNMLKVLDWDGMESLIGSGS